MREHVKHLSVVRPGPFGSTVTGSFCGLARTVRDGMNLVDEWESVTCKRCLAKMSDDSKGDGNAK